MTASPAVGSHLARQQIPHDDAHRPTLGDDQIQHLGSVVKVDRACRHLPHQCRIGPEQELLAGLAPGVEGARHLRPAEGAVVEETSVLPGEGHPRCDALVDDGNRHLGEAVDVGLATAVVAALDGVVEEPEDAVAVVLVVLGGIDAALRGDGVRPAWGVVVREGLDPVAQLAERGRGGRTGQARSHHDDGEAALIVGVDEAQGELVVRPGVLDRPLGQACIQTADHPAPPAAPRGFAAGVDVLDALAHDRAPAVVDDAGLDEDREAEIADEDHRSECLGEPATQRVPARAVDPETLEHAPGAVVDVHRQGHVGDDVPDGHRQAGQACHDVVVGVTAHVVGIEVPPGQVGKVVDDEKPDEGSRPAHRARGVAGGDVVPTSGVAAVGRSAHPGQAVRRVNVETEGADEAEAHRPQHPGAGDDLRAEIPQGFGVLVRLPGTLVEVQIAEHVHQHEPQQGDPGERHDPLLAHCRLVEIQRPREFVSSRTGATGDGGLRGGRRGGGRTQRRRSSVRGAGARGSGGSGGRGRAPVAVTLPASDPFPGKHPK